MMATAIACDMCGAEPGTVMQTNMKNGDVLAVGDNCQLPFHLTVVQTIIENMPAEAVGEYATALAPLIGQLTESLSTAAAQAAGDENPGTGGMTAYELATGEKASEEQQDAQA